MNVKIRLQQVMAMAVLSFMVLQAAPALAKTPELTNAASTTPTSGAGPGNSYNWSGYMSTGKKFTSVSGTWTVPSVNPAGSSQAAEASWVGIGGVGEKDLIQAGTQSIVENGRVIYRAWTELLPAACIPLTDMAVKPGDSITVTIALQSGSQWNMTLKNNTNGQSHSENVTYNNSLTSAEWVEEMPSSSGGLIALDNFGTVNFSDNWAVTDGGKVNIAQSSAQKVTLVDKSHQVLATPSALGSDGSSFSVTRSNVSSVASSGPTTSVNPYNPYGSSYPTGSMPYPYSVGTTSYPYPTGTAPYPYPQRSYPHPTGVSSYPTGYTPYPRTASVNSARIQELVKQLIRMGF